MKITEEGFEEVLISPAQHSAIKLIDENALGMTVTAVTATTPKVIVGRGKIISYCEAPTVTIETENGRRIHWRADLCEIEEKEN